MFMPSSADINFSDASYKTDFSSVIQSPLNRTVADRYLLVIKLPDALQNKSASYVLTNEQNGISKKSVQWSIISCSIPHDVMKMQQIQYAGAAMSISSHTRSPVDNFRITYKIDNMYKNYLTMYEWYNLIQDQTEGIFDAHNLTERNTYDQYAADVNVIALDEYNEPVVKWVFRMAFPIEIGEIGLDYTKTDEIEMNVTFAYSWKEVFDLRRDDYKTRNKRV